MPKSFSKDAQKPKEKLPEHFFLSKEFTISLLYFDSKAPPK